MSIISWLKKMIKADSIGHSFLGYNGAIAEQESPKSTASQKWEVQQTVQQLNSYNLITP